jgi:aminoglycoside 3-N-acetyltransferase
MLTKQNLIQSFEALGIRTGARLVVHSALRSLGPVDGGADAVIDALIACIGPEGLLVMPTFTYGGDTFDPNRSPSRTGMLTEVFRQRPGVVRSNHPTHSIAAWGRGAASVCADHERVPALGVDSPLDRTARSGGTILLLGVGHNSNSTVHVGEAHARVPYLDIPFSPDRTPRAKIVRGEETVREVQLKEQPGCSRAFGYMEAALRRKGAVRDGKVGMALVQWMSGQAVIDCTVQVLKEDPAALLCTDPGCYRCSRARERMT